MENKPAAPADQPASVASVLLLPLLATGAAGFEMALAFLYVYIDPFPNIMLGFLFATFPLVAGMAIYRPTLARPEPKGAAAQTFGGRARWLGMITVASWGMGVLVISSPKVHLSVPMAIWTGLFGSMGIGVGWALRPTQVTFTADAAELRLNGRIEWRVPWSDVTEIRRGGSIVLGPKGVPASQPWILLVRTGGDSVSIECDRLPPSVFNWIEEFLKAEAGRRGNVRWTSSVRPAQS